MEDITVLLERARAKDSGAVDALFALVYEDVRRMARARLAGNQRITLLETTGLAHEAYLRLRKLHQVDLASRAQLMAYVSEVLKTIIVDYARRRRAERRGGGQRPVTLDTEVADTAGSEETEVEQLADALEVLGSSDPRLRQIVEMRYFGGMTDDEIGEALGISARTVGRDWQRARLMLSVALKR